MAGEILEERHGDVVVLHLLGEHDLSNAEKLTTAIASPAEAGQGVVVSLIETGFIDSTTIHALYRADRVLQSGGRRLALHVATEAVVQRVLEISGLTSDLPSTGVLEEALALAARDEGG